MTRRILTASAATPTISQHLDTIVEFAGKAAVWRGELERLEPEGKADIWLRNRIAGAEAIVSMHRQIIVERNAA